ncbi:hypothetical protein PHYBOEH_005882 [Phytophthora boehmeriae]|uniref:TFIIS N-terminal domain-containing protein n=1 Tax=Phytophthora boehmeriae TaxID=109152 RepID=A0A8T1WKW7_9STRA|nr:hypothetical protein PHYBOEH_005882 [Phytophthora boehmeriae]
MVRMREPQRYPLGTRVANPVEGRTGQISAFDAASGLYTLEFNDQHREELNAAQVEAFVIRKSAAEKAAEEAKKAQQKARDPLQFLGATVTKTSTSYEGKELVSSGQVTQYFADIKKFRVLFSDGLYSDMSLDEVKQSLKTETGAKRPAETEAGSAKKKSKHRHHHHHRQEQEEAKERPLNTQKFESRKIAYTMCREVLTIIVSQKKVGKLCTEKQKVILNNKDLQPKRALEGFVEADGLRSLEGILSQWFRSDNTRSASLLVLKVLAMLPGVTEAQLRKTNIARTLRGIEKLSRSMDHIDLVFGDLAEWIIQKWARTAMNRTFNPSARDLLLAQQAQISRAGSDGQVHVAPRPPSKMTAQQKETARLEALRTGADAGPADGTEVDPGEEVVVYLPQFNSLGSEDMRRPVRQTQVIESLAEKINRDYEDSVRKHNEDDEEKDDGVTDGRIVFRKPQLMHFSQNAPVIELFSTARSKIVGATSSSTTGNNDGTVSFGGDDGNNDSPPKPLPKPNKTQAPKKSILKKRDEVVVPASQVTWQ